MRCAVNVLLVHASSNFMFEYWLNHSLIVSGFIQVQVGGYKSVVKTLAAAFLAAFDSATRVFSKVLIFYNF